MRNKKQNTRAPFAKRSLGQNFLTDPNFVQKIIDSLGPIQDDLVIEIGPGRGALTSQLVGKAKKIIAIELDRIFADSLREKYLENANFEVIEQDILTVDVEAVAGDVSGFENLKFVANLPYNISTAILEMLAEVQITYAQAVLMFQKEVVSRITAKPGSRERGYLTVITEASFETEYLFDVPPTAFKPVPKVMSAVVRLRPKKDLAALGQDLFRTVVSAGFRQKRKTVANNLKQMEGVIDAKKLLRSAGIDPGLRAEALELGDWVAITELIARESGVDRID